MQCMKHFHTLPHPSQEIPGSEKLMVETIISTYPIWAVLVKHMLSACRILLLSLNTTFLIPVLYSMFCSSDDM